MRTTWDHSRLFELFEAALDTPPSERVDFLKGECGGDEALYSQVLVLLHANDHPHHVLRTVDATVSVVAGSESTIAETHSPGEIIGDRYRIDRFLGRGGMGEVWLSFDLKLRLNVALKSVLADRFSRRDELDLIRHEVLSARAVISPNVCRIFDLHELDGREYVAMEFIDGKTLLETLVERGPLSLREAASIASQVLAGLQSIHDAGLVHGDIKPENIMITRSDRVVLMDFGLAKPIAEEVQIAGTRAYMAPERLRGAPLDARADVFAAGVTLAEMVAPGGIRSRESRSSMQQGIRDDPPCLPVTPWAPVLRRAVAQDPGDRLGSADEFVRALDQITLRAQKSEGRSPYPGLIAFSEEDAEFFFGRELEVESLWRKLGRVRLLGLIGPSGVGKSSFIRAGLLPALPDGWRSAICHPGASPTMALARALLPPFEESGGASEAIVRVDEADTLVAMFARWRQQDDAALLIVDQFEELFTQNPPEMQERFASLLARLVLEADVHVLLSTRDDFLVRCHALSGLKPMFSDLTVLDPPTGAALRRVLVQPALLCGYRFEDETLVDRMLREVAEERGSLPLLAFAVSRLWEERDRAHGLLTRDAYDRIGGVVGALAQHAEETAERIGRDRHSVVRELFRNLVTAEGTRVSREWDELLSVFPQAGRRVADDVLRALVDARLLTAFEVPVEKETTARRRVEVIHEALLTEWPRLVRWRTQDADGVQMRDQLRQAARLWEQRGRPAELLWSKTSYLEYRAWRARYPGGLTETEDAFADAMVANAGRRRRRRRLTTAGAFLILVVVLAAVGGLWRQSVGEARRAEASKLVALGRMELDRHPTAAVAHALASLELADSPDARILALDALWRAPAYSVLTAALGRGRQPWGVEFSPDGGWLAVGDMDAPEINLYPRNGGAPTTLTANQSAWCKRIFFTSDPDLIVSDDLFGIQSPATRIWSVSEGRAIRTLTGCRPLFVAHRDDPMIMLDDGDEQTSGAITQRSIGAEGSTTLWHGINPICPVVDPSGRWLAYSTPERDGQVGADVFLLPIHEAGTAVPRLLGRHEDTIDPAGWFAFDSRGERLATADRSREIRVWSIDRDSTWFLRLKDDGMSQRLAFTPDGRQLVSANVGGVISLWNLRGQPTRIPLLGLGSTVWGLAIHPEGQWIATSGTGLGGLGDVVTLWPLGRGYPRVLRGHAERVLGLAFAPDGSWLASASWDGTVRRWSLVSADTEESTVILEGRHPFFSLTVDPEGKRWMAGRQDGIDLLEQHTPTRRTNLDAPLDIYWAVAVSRDGRLLAAGGGQLNDANEVVRVWRTGSDRLHRVLDPETPDEVDEWITDLEFLPDGRLLSSGAGGLVRWDIEDETREVIRARPVWRFDVSPPGDRLLIIEWDHSADVLAGPVCVYDIETREALALRSHGDQVHDVAFHPDGRSVVSLDIMGVVRVGPLTGEEPHLLPGHGELARGALAVSPDGRWVAAGGADDGSISLFPVPRGAPLHTLPRAKLLGQLRAQTNLRVVRDEQSSTGYRFDFDDFPGWETVSTW